MFRRRRKAFASATYQPWKASLQPNRYFIGAVLVSSSKQICCVICVYFTDGCFSLKLITLHILKTYVFKCNVSHSYTERIKCDIKLMLPSSIVSHRKHLECQNAVFCNKMWDHAQAFKLNSYHYTVQLSLDSEHVTHPQHLDCRQTLCCARSPSSYSSTCLYQFCIFCCYC